MLLLLIIIVFLSTLSLSSTTRLSSSTTLSKDSTKKRYYSCIMTKVKAMISTSGCNLLEWIEYNIILGFNQIYITDDCSIDQSNILPILQYYESLGIVTIIKSYNNYIECQQYRPNEGRTYKRMLFGAKAKQNCVWITNIDYDEYITFYDVKNDNINDYLATYPYNFIRMPWFVFGNQGYEQKPNKLIIDAYFSGSMEKPRYIKTIAVSDAIKNFQSPHLPNLYDNDVNTPMKRVNFKRKTLPSGIPNSTLNNKYWINGCHNDEMKLVPIEQATMKKVVLNTAVFDKYSNNSYDDMYRNSITLDKNTTIYIPATEIFIKHYKYLSWDEYRLQRAGTATLPNGRHNYFADNPRSLWEKGNNTIYKQIDKNNKISETTYTVKYYEIDTNIALSYTAKMITLLRKAINKRIQDMKLIKNTNNIYDIIKRDCHFI